MISDGFTSGVTVSSSAILDQRLFSSFSLISMQIIYIYMNRIPSQSRLFDKDGIILYHCNKFVYSNHRNLTHFDPS